MSCGHSEKGVDWREELDDMSGRSYIEITEDIIKRNQLYGEHKET